MNRYLKKITGIILILIGMIFFVSFERVAQIIFGSLLFHIIFLIYCAVQYYFSSIKRNHIKIFLSAFFFFITVVLISANSFEILKLDKLLITSAYLIPGLSFLFLYIGERKEKSFLIITAIWFITGGAMLNFFPNEILMNLVSGFINVFLTALPLLSISFGILNLLKKNH